jgi:carboxyl-terminal processing protease
LKKYPKLTAAVIACVCCIAVTAAVCLLGFRERGDYAKYEEIQSIIRQHYIGEVDEAAMDDAVSRAYVSALNDRWSYYMSPEEYVAYKQYTANQYIGVGATVELDKETKLPVITDVAKDSPAFRAGLEAGNNMVALEGESLEGKGTAELRELMQSFGDKSFTLTVMNAQGATRDVELICELVTANPVQYEMLSSNIGSVRITNFEDGCAESLKSAVSDLLSRGASALIFDVRDNPGGKVSELIDVLDYLLPKGDLFISRDKNGAEKVYTSDAKSVDKPMAVLINGNSFSAAEYFAAVLGEYEAAVLVGEPTTGKGRSQTTVELSDGSAVHLSNNVYLTPAGLDLSETGGVKPDIESHPVEDSPLDVQLRAAENALS